MIGNEKRNIILTYGTDVQIFSPDDKYLYDTKALVGKGTKNSLQEVSIEYHRQVQLVPEIDLVNGTIMYMPLTKEKYIAVASMEEIVLNEKIATIVRFLQSNATVTITGVGEVADENGNVKTSSIVRVADQPAYITFINAELPQFKAGYFEKADYLMYIAATDIDLLDQVKIMVAGREKRMKVETVDYLSFVGLALVGLVTETRA